MKTFTKILAIVMAALMLFSFAACAKQEQPKDPNQQKPEDKPQEPENPDPEKPDPEKPDPENPDPEPEKPKDDFWDIAAKPPRVGDKSCLPDFTEREIEKQKMKGTSIVEQIKQAAADTSKKEFVIPAGDYGFDKRLELLNLKRPDDNPLTIKADGVTFWMDNRTVKHDELAPFIINNCENIYFVNLTVDEYSQRTIEGSVTQIDRKNNRISIKLSNSSMRFDDSFIPNILKKARTVPFKPNGDYIAALYGGQLYVKDLKPTGNEEEYWITFKNGDLMKNIFDKTWELSYGKNAILEVGDLINLYFGESNFYINNCKQLHFIGFTSHFTNGMVLENGGYGNNLWKDCYFGPREGTSKLMSACEYMFQGTRHGSTLDNVFIASSSDDQINTHGFWLTFSNVRGKTADVEHMMGGLKGDKVEFYSKEGKLLKTLTLAKDKEGNKVEFTQNIPAYHQDCIIRNPAYECDGWVVKNCTFLNNYQALILGSGNGVFENNKVYNMGSTVAVRSFWGSIEGGFLGDVSIKNNTFYNSMTRPGGVVFDIYQMPSCKGNIMGGTVDICDNLFVNCGQIVKATYFENINVKNNIAVEPLMYKQRYNRFEQLVGKFTGVGASDISDNEFYSTNSSNANGTNTAKRIDEKLADRIAFYVYNSDKDSKGIIEVVKNNLK